MPLDLPASPAGDTPELGMSYSSGVVDGLTNATNTQASQAGLGWGDFANAFIERRYEPCLAAQVLPINELCWEGYNGTISLEGVSGALLPLDAGYTEWAVRSDEGWKVERLTGADNGAHAGEHWKVTATDGTEYFFGLGESPSGGGTSSAWRVPVWGDHAGEPCWNSGSGSAGVCHEMAWRWNLDRVVDPDGNITVYTYNREQNFYCTLNCAQVGPVQGSPQSYHRGGRLSTVEWGWQEGDTAPAARVVSSSEGRCTALSSCPTPTRNNGNQFPDVPNDLICGSSCTQVTSPAFFSTRRYATLQAEVRVGSEWRPVTRYRFGHGWGENSDGVHKLRVNGITREGLWLGSTVPYPSVTFLYEELPNRVDVNLSQGRPPMGHERLTLVMNEYGGLLGVGYGHNRQCPSNHSPQLWHDNDRDCFPQEIVDGGTLRTGVFHKYLTLEVGEEPGDGSPRIETTYEYGIDGDDDPAWAFNQGAFAQGNGRWGWSVWRGYGTTTITQGTPRTRVRVFRGMDGDALWADCGGGFSGGGSGDPLVVWEILVWRPRCRRRVFLVL